jgi:aminoglycoside phosphotransferase (APT) family kinase protein
VVRFAQTAAAGAAQEVEALLLPLLDCALPVLVPVPALRIAPSALAPHGAIGHAKLPGEPLARPAASPALARDVARFLRALHAFPVRRARNAGAPDAPGWRHRVLAVADLLPALRVRLSPAERERLEEWWGGALNADATTSYPPALRHGDAWYENFLVDGAPARLTAVLDWEGVAVGDPAEDLAPQFYLGSEFAEAVLLAYGADEEVRARVRLHRGLREFAGLRWAVEHADEVELDESVAKLRRSPIFAA